MQLANRLESVRVSPTVAISAKARDLKAAGNDIIGLAAGEPDFDTPENIQQAARDAMARGETHYGDAAGIVELRQAVCDKMKRDSGLDYSSDQVIVGAGGKQVIFNAMMATLNPGDEVIIPAPYWVSYPDIVLLLDATPVIVPTLQSDHFKITAEALEQAITSKTRWLFLNSPSNPTGSMYRKEEYQQLGEVLKKYPNIMVMTDDIYESLSFGVVPFCTFAEAVPELYDRTLVVNGVSKAYAMTGWRIGYGATNKALVAAMKKIQGQSTMHPSSIAQWAAVEALAGPQDVLDDMLQVFTRRRNMISEALASVPGIDVSPPDGAFYIFASIDAHLGKTTSSGQVLKSDADWVMALMEEQGVALVPGSAFGMDNYFRLSFAAADDDLSRAAQRIAEFSAGLR